jgi:hypothetical protein
VLRELLQLGSVPLRLRPGTEPWLCVSYADVTPRDLDTETPQVHARVNRAARACELESLE